MPEMRKLGHDAIGVKRGGFVEHDGRGREVSAASDGGVAFLAASQSLFSFWNIDCPLRLETVIKTNRSGIRNYDH
jgi:hypothetical protein